MPDEPVVLTQDGSVATLLLNRPDKLNALDENVTTGLVSALSAVAREPRVRVVVITGAGRGFCAGGDIVKMAELKNSRRSEIFRNFLETGHDLVRQIRQLPKPVVASVNGPAAGGGMNLALACDLRIASNQATFMQAFVRIGLHPDWGGTFFLPRLIGVGRAVEMFFLGEALGAEEAHRMGVVNFLVPHDQLAAETKKLAERLAAAPPLPLALIKQALYEHLETRLDLMMGYEVSAQMRCFKSEDFAEGLKAFLEKRKPGFKGA
ncbi:MAG TPA: enoyl-CoA hydratase [Terriglobia bacterium]|nr:enoyl-CoA hydratase [Terriglobia bacterium]